MSGGVLVLSAVQSGGATTVRLSGSVYWWIEAEREGCPSIRSSTMHLDVVPTRRRAAL